VATGTSAAIGIESSGLIRLAFPAEVSGSVTLLSAMLAADFWIMLLLAERSRRKAEFEPKSFPRALLQLEEVEVSGPFFLTRDGLS
jgi:hypothetical protein